MDDKYWFEKKSKQFLKNIDTFYYSVYLEEDNSKKVDFCHSIKKYRNFLERLDVSYDTSYKFGEFGVIYSPGRFGIYNYRLQIPEFFDVFLAYATPTKASPVIVVQLRSRCLWEEGVYAAYKKSFAFVNTFCDHFGLHISEVKENRCDFCCHSNYLSAPEKFFAEDNFVKMWIGSVGHDKKEGTKSWFNHNVAYDDDSIEKDYIAIGKRCDKCFIRIYLKSKEVVQQGYKGWFLIMWQLSGLISRYDLWCLEEAYKRTSWNYVQTARLRWALQYDDTLKEDDRQIISDAVNNETSFNTIRRLAKKYTRNVTQIFNVEFQCMRDMTKNFELIPRNEGVDARVMDYLDNYSLIYEYLTRVCMRLVRTDSADTNKARRPNCEFWERLRNAKTVEFKKKHKDMKLIRKYSSTINFEVRKKRAYNALSSYGYCFNRNINGSIMEDASLLLSTLNDNDLAAIDQHKIKISKHHVEDIPDNIKRFRNVCWCYDPETGYFY